MINSISDYTCFQEALKNVCLKYNKDFTLFFAREWGFEFCENKEQTIGERINVCNFFQMNQFIEKYMGYTVDFYKSTDNLPFIIKEAIQTNRAILAGMDSYGCNWNPAYQKSHIPHFFLIEEWNDAEQTMLCIDTYYSEKKYTLLYEDLRKYFRNLRIIQNKKPVESIGMEEIKNILATNYQWQKKKPQYYFQEFADAVSGITDIEQLFPKNTDVGNSILMQKLKNLIINRFEIGKLILRYSPKDSKTAEKFSDLGKQWEIVKVSLIKLFLMRKVTKDKLQQIAGLILEIGAREEELYRCICMKNLELYLSEIF